MLPPGVFPVDVADKLGQPTWSSDVRAAVALRFAVFRRVHPDPLY